jgi:kynurenine 3-monooxygenase
MSVERLFCWVIPLTPSSLLRTGNELRVRGCSRSRLASGKTCDDWETVYGEYGKLRKANTDAIADMAEENFYEMRDATADPVFQRKRELETKLEQTYSDYFSKYSMVTFREDMPYAVAKEIGNAQDELLMEICRQVDDVKSLDVEKVIEQVRKLH